MNAEAVAPVHTSEALDDSARFAAPQEPRRINAFATSAGRKRDGFYFEPRSSEFYLEVAVKLRNRPSQIAFSRTYHPVQFALFQLERIAPIITRDDDEWRVVMKQVDKDFTAFSAYIEGESARATKMLEDNLRPLDSGGHNRIEEKAVRVYTPRVRKFIECIQAADQLITNYARLWMEGFMDEVDFKRCNFRLRTRSINLAKSIYIIHTKAYAKLRRDRAEAERRANESTVQAEREAAEAVVRQSDAIISDVVESGIDTDKTPDMGEAELHAEDPHMAESEMSPLPRSKRRTKAESVLDEGATQVQPEDAGAAATSDAA
ncbi:hypothetical protein [Metallibacterium scheffleri]|uniref:Uncharacterized protein n=1 Tax=Metallibacterium scheffleri TaxID=993689 RepID=A0A4S3KQP2_9GAMM|nr:hypothetical protein [Metallibacterium scheffleri]THD11319.1 hypothetical protein B1806_04150 [Metallibacterium scheffleri]